jgi:hypothetical protein
MFPHCQGKTGIFLEVVSKPPLGLNLCVGLRCSILKIFTIFLRLPVSVALTLNPIEGFETTSN